MHLVPRGISGLPSHGGGEHGVDEFEHFGRRLTVLGGHAEATAPQRGTQRWPRLARRVVDVD